MPPERYYGFYHAKDSAPYTFILEANYEVLLGIRPSHRLDVETASSLDGVHRLLFTEKTLNEKQSPHTYPVLERFAEVHQYLAGTNLPDG